MKKFYMVIGAMLASTLGFAQISLTHLSAYETGVFDEGAAEIAAYDSTNQQLVFTNSNDNELEIIDFSDPANPLGITAIDLSPYGGGVNSVKVFGNGIYAVAVEADVKQDSGALVFFDHTGQYLNQVQCGPLPDMVQVSKDGSLLIVANEGEPSDDYTRDPEGSVTIVDVSGGVAAASVVHADFNGVSIDPNVNIYGLDTIALINEDFEDQTIGISNWSQVTLTPNNVSWIHDDFSGDYFAEASGFKGGSSTNGPSNDWLISGALSLHDFASAELNFQNAMNFSDNGGGTFNVLITTDDASDSTGAVSATWDTLSFNRSGGGYAEEASGAIDLSAYTGNTVYLGLNYTSSGSQGGEAELWQIDDVLLTGSYGDANNLEPEYIAISDDNSTAYAILQENNAIALIDVASATITNVLSLGYKDHSQVGNGLDPSDKDSGIKIAEHPVFGMYQPDAITYINIGGQGYILSANEGDARDYDAYSEEERIKDITLDPTAFPNAVELQEDSVLGRLNITTSLGDTDGDGDFDELYAYGARSFSIWNGSTGALVWDSGDDFEQITAQEYPNDFNSNNDENGSFEKRSDNKGPEPEAITTALFNGEPYALIGLERMGGIMVYNISDPADPQFVTYVNNRDFSVDAELPNGDPNPAVGDLGIEDIIVINGSQSPDGNTYVVTSNEVSGTVSIFTVEGIISNVSETTEKTFALRAYPNPVSGDVINLNKMGDYELFDVSGRIITESRNSKTINVNQLESGVYFIRNGEGETVSFVKK